MELSSFSSCFISMIMIITSFVDTVYSSNSSFVVFNGKLRGIRYTTYYGLSLAECMDKCRVRSRCQSVNYERQLLRCRLNKFKTDADARLHYTKSSSSVLIMLKDYSQANQEKTNKVDSSNALYNVTLERPYELAPGQRYCPCQFYVPARVKIMAAPTRLHKLQCGNVTCSRYQNCVYETAQCVVTECRGLPRPKNGYKVGNTVRVGAKTLLYCDDNTYVLNTLTLPVQTICQPDSNWTVGKLECFTIYDLCYKYLVSGPSGLLVESINASSTFDNSLLPEYAVLNGSSSWAATYDDNENPYIEVKFLNKRHITGVATQGRDDDAYNQYVTSYSVAYSVDCITFNNVPDSLGDRMVFDGNTDMNSIVTNQFDSPVEALCVRINAITWSDHPSMRIDILGCEDNDISNYRLYTGD